MAAYGDCKRLRYLTYHYGGKGLQRTVASLPLINGDFVHKALACLVQGEDMDGVLEALANQYRAEMQGRTVHGELDLEFLINEQLTLLEGLVRAWGRVRLKAVLAEYDIVDVEREVEWEMAPGIIVMLRMDLVLRRKRDKLLFVKDYKTVGTLYDDWAKKFEHDTQLLCYTLAAESIYKEPIGGLLMEGLIKGRRAKEKAVTSPFHGLMIQQSPLCYAYKVPVAKGHNHFVYERGWSRGAEKVPVWEMPGGIEHWLATEWSDLDCQELFVPLPAIKPVRRDAERWLAQMTHQEDMVQSDVSYVEERRVEWEAQQTDDAWDAYQDALNTYFPQNQNHCHRYSFNHPCPNEQMCFTEEVETDPIGSGLYQVRVPHHSTEDSEAA
jgi:hypothetical protein